MTELSSASRVRAAMALPTVPRALMWAMVVAAFAALLFVTAGCGSKRERLEPRFLTWAELRVVRRGVTVTPPGEKSRAPHPRDRLADGARIDVATGGLAWLRRDAGVTLLVSGPARLRVRARSVEVDEGRVFVDTPPGAITELETPSGKLQLSHVRASLDVGKDGTTHAYVLSGEIKAGPGGALHAAAGEMLSIGGSAAPSVTPQLSWEDWTGGLATTDRAASPAPFGIGTVGARPPGDQGSARFPLAIQRMDVRVTIEGDFALTEVDQTFFNPSSKTVEGIYAFRAPERAILHRFGVDRDGVVVWGRVKEKQAAAAQYQKNVYEGSKEDPALLEWDGPNSYRARLYPIKAGESRRVVVRYGQWLDRTGPAGERRLYVYPMAAEGSEESLPHIEELKVTFDLRAAGMREARIGMAGVRDGANIVVRAQDLVPRADLALELFDDGPGKARALRAPHAPDLDALPPSDRDSAKKAARDEADYVLVPVRAEQMPAAEGGLDLVIVVDASAATDPAALAVERAATAALLGHLGDNDRAVVWAGADGVRPVVSDWKTLAKVDNAARQRVLTALATLERGGATDLGAMIASAAAVLDPARRGAVVYIGDGAPTVGELSLKDLRARLDKLPHPVRVFGVGVGDEANMALLEGLSRGAFAERVGDAYQAATAALNVLESAERSAWLGTKIDLGPNVERVEPRDTSALVSEQTLLVVGRLVKSKVPERVKLEGTGGTRDIPLEIASIDDHGDLRRRWAEERLRQMIDDGEGRAAMVDLGSQSGIVTPVTSFYVPTKNEMSDEERQELENRRPKPLVERDRRSKPPLAKVGQPIEMDAVDNKEGGTGMRAKGEEASLGNPAPQTASKRYAVQGPKDEDKPEASKPREAQEFGMIGLLNSAAEKPPPPAGAEKAKSLAEATELAPAAPPASPAPSPSATVAAEPKIARATAPSRGDSVVNDTAARGNAWGADIGESFGAGGLGMSGYAGTLGQGFGSGHGRLGASHRTTAPTVRLGATSISGSLPPELISRVVRQNFGRYRLCYEQGLSKNPSLEGRVSARFVIGKTGDVSNVSNAGSDLPDSGVVGCVIAAFSGLSFPQPDTGVVTVVVPIVFAPGAPSHAPSGAAAAIQISIKLGDLPRLLARCSAAEGLALDERVALWRERLAQVVGNPNGAVQVYHSALSSCEAPSWRERSRLLSLMLDSMPNVKQRVDLWRAMFADFGAADALYRGILARVRTPEQRRELSAALGLKTIDPGLFQKSFAAVKDSATRVTKLRQLFVEWPDDFSVALALLDALEDAGDDAGARDLARRLRARPDADARLRTAVGELQLRLAGRAASPAQKESDVDEARRAFGEIVEFAPDDPVARRRLGDLLRAHGWYAEAERQYETLARLAPDDTSVALLLGATAEGRGRLEEAVKWAEKGAQAGSPEEPGGPLATSRALAATWLAWGRLAAREANRTDELKALTARAERVLAAIRAGTRSAPKSVRATLVWSHPELHPTLFSDALGAPMPAPEADVTLGVAQVVMAERDGSHLEVRLEPGDVERAARLGAEALLTVVFDELNPGEKIVRLPVRFERGGAATVRFTIAGREVTREAVKPAGGQR